MVRVSIDESFYSDPRFFTLADLTGEHHYMSKMRVLYIWLHAYRIRSAVLPRKEINEQSSWFRDGCYSEFLVKARLADIVCTENVRIRGVEDRIKYLLVASKKGRLGAEKRWNAPKNEAIDGGVDNDSKPHTNPIENDGVLMAGDSYSYTNPIENDGVLWPNPNPNPKLINTTVKPKQSPKKRACLTDDPEWVELGRHWLNHATSIKPNGPNIYQDWNPNTFGYHLEKAAKRHELDLDFMYEVFNFVAQDDFWRINAISPAGLSKKITNGLSKLDNITNKMGARKPEKEPEQLSIPSFEFILRREQELKAQFENKGSEVEP